MKMVHQAANLSGFHFNGYPSSPIF